MSLRAIEIVSVPVSDVDRAKAYYTETLRFALNIDNPIGEGIRWVQVTPGLATWRIRPGYPP